MKNLIMKSGMAVLACFGMSVSVSAQALTCSDLIWNDDVAASTAPALTIAGSCLTAASPPRTRSPSKMKTFFR
jgi:hypothetical protein